MKDSVEVLYNAHGIVLIKLIVDFPTESMSGPFHTHTSVQMRQRKVNSFTLLGLGRVRLPFKILT